MKNIRNYYYYSEDNNKRPNFIFVLTVKVNRFFFIRRNPRAQKEKRKMKHLFFLVL